MSRHAELLLVRERVAALTAQRCRLAHEQVIMEDGQARRRSNGEGLQPAVVRIGLCPRSVRDKQLACAHTGARNALESAIRVLAQENMLEQHEACRLRAELETIASTIHRTDWEKNASEERYALLLEQAASSGMPPPSLAAERQGLADLVSQHDACVTALRHLQEAVLTALDQGLAASR